MKFMLLSLALLLLASTMTTFPEAEASGKPVFDIKGLELLPDVPYYLYTGPIGGGVVDLGDSKNDTDCPDDVVLRPRLINAVGTPVTFKIAGGQPSFFISDITDVFISFNTTSNCTDHVQSMVWQHEKDSADEFTEFLKIDGVEGNFNTIFRIVQVGSFGILPTYKLAAYTLSSSSALHLSLRDVGLYNDFNSGTRRLALTEPPLSFFIGPDDIKGLKDM